MLYPLVWRRFDRVPDVQIAKSTQPANSVAVGRALNFFVRFC